MKGMLRKHLSAASKSLHTASLCATQAKQFGRQWLGSLVSRSVLPVRQQSAFLERALCASSLLSQSIGAISQSAPMSSRQMSSAD